MGENATLTYSLEPESNLFNIDPSSGTITVANSVLIDREQRPAIQLVVKAVDGGLISRRTGK